MFNSKSSNLENIKWSNNVKELTLISHRVKLINPSLPPNLKIIKFEEYFHSFDNINLPDNITICIDTCNEYINTLPSNISNLIINEFYEPVTNLPCSLKELVFVNYKNDALEKSKIPYGCKVKSLYFEELYDGCI